MVGIRWLMILGFFGILSSCTKEVVPPAYYPRNAFDAYAHALKSVGLERSALGAAWFASADAALQIPVMITAPYKEVFFLDPAGAEAVGYRMAVKRGQKISISLTIPQDSQKVFIDLFRVNNDSLKDWTHVASADTLSHRIAFEPRRDADYIVRIQPELLRGGRYEVEMLQVPSLQFPVAGKSSQAIGSFFGDPRDGGKRDHHGVDIFALRKTPILAPSKAYVRNVSIRGLGGKVVWLYDSKRRMSMYFAHLDSQIVQQNTYVDIGDTLGLVGNTGNARYTPPHLHFGIYSNGPIDPIHYLQATDTVMKQVEVPESMLGQLMRVRTKSLLYLQSDLRRVVDTLQAQQLVLVKGGTSQYCRVSTFDDLLGFVPLSLLESAEEPVASTPSQSHQFLLSGPGRNAIGEVFSGDSLQVYGAHEHFQWVQTYSGKRGWISGG